MNSKKMTLCSSIANQHTPHNTHSALDIPFHLQLSREGYQMKTGILISIFQQRQIVVQDIFDSYFVFETQDKPNYTIVRVVKDKTKSFFRDIFRVPNTLKIAPINAIKILMEYSTSLENPAELIYFCQKKKKKLRLYCYLNQTLIEFQFEIELNFFSALLIIIYKEFIFYFLFLTQH